MAKVEELTTDQWIEKFDGSRQRWLQRMAMMRAEVRADDSLPDLDRAILGTTGSPEKLRFYQKMVTLINESQGKPIVVIEAGDQDMPLNAVGGVIVGVVEAEFTDNDERNMTSSQLRVPIANGFRWYRNEEDVEDCSHRPFIDVARFDADIIPAGSEAGAPYYSLISPEAVLFGSRFEVFKHIFKVERVNIVNDVSAQFEQLSPAQTA